MENETKIENDFSPNDQITDWEYWGKKISAEKKS